MAFRYDKQVGVDIQNTGRGIDSPENADEFNHLDANANKPLELLPVMTGDYFMRLVPYPVIVEQWNKKNYGRHKRAWLRDFTQAERNKIASYHGRFHHWYLSSGTPQRVSCRIKTLELLQRAAAWFAALE